jgi:hypothetical protein
MSYPFVSKYSLPCGGVAWPLKHPMHRFQAKPFGNVFDSIMKQFHVVRVVGFVSLQLRQHNGLCWTLYAS